MGKHSQAGSGRQRPEPVSSRRRLRTKIKAVLAGGLVLGVGMTTTLAAWTDLELARGTFTTSTFDIESAVNGSTFANHPTGQEAVMTFSGTGMTPSSIRYATLDVRTKIGSIAGTVTLNGATVTNPTVAAELTYRVATYTGTCGATTFTGTPDYLIGGAGPSRVALSTAAAPRNLAAATSTVPGTALRLCFEVQLKSTAPNTMQGQTVTATWQLSATSVQD